MSGKSDQAAGPRDARFEDSYRPARIAVADAEDLAVLSALLQDSVALTGDFAFLPKERRFAFIANRYRWEEPAAQERVRAGAHFNHVLHVSSSGVDLSAKERPLSILALRFEPAPEPPGGVIWIECAGDIALSLQIEALEGALSDMSQPWRARATPDHGQAEKE